MKTPGLHETVYGVSSANVTKHDIIAFFVRNEMSRIVIFLSWSNVTNRDGFFVVRNGPNEEKKRHDSRHLSMTKHHDS